MLCVGKTREVYIITNMYNPPASCHFVDEEGNASKPLHTASYEYVFCVCE